MWLTDSKNIKVCVCVCVCLSLSNLVYVTSKLAFMHALTRMQKTFFEPRRATLDLHVLNVFICVNCFDNFFYDKKKVKYLK